MMPICCCEEDCHVTPPDVPEFRNITRVADHVTSVPNPDGIDPYARNWNVIVGGTTCEPASSVSPTECGAADQVVCYFQGFDGVTNTGDTFTEPTGILPCGTAAPGSGPLDVVGGNCFQATGNMVSFASADPVANCHKFGWKGVQAMAVWPGTFGFINSGAACCTGTPTTEGLEQTKYLTMTATVAGGVTETTSVWTYDPGSDTEETHTYDSEASNDWKQVCTVDANGNLSRSGHRIAHKTSTNDSVTTEDYNYACAIDDVAMGFTAFYTATNDTLPIVMPPGEDLISASCGQISWTDLTGLHQGTAAELTALELFSQGTEGTVVTGDGISYLQTRTITSDRGTFTLTDTEIRFTFSGTITNDEKNWDGSAVLIRHSIATANWSYTQVVSLSDPLAFSTVVDNVKDLLGEWNLTDDAVYPWRIDNKTWLQPYVTRHAAAIAPSIIWTVDENCDFQQSNTYTGELLGAPMPAGYGYCAASATYAGFWDWRAILWRKTNDGMGSCQACQIALGQFTPDEIPRSATKWTDRKLGASMYGPGALLAQRLDYNYDSGGVGYAPLDGVFAQKWAETLEEWPSLNYNRPCGHDHFKRDESDVVCVDSAGTNDATTLTILVAPTNPWSEGDFIGMNAQVYRITSIDGTLLIYGVELVTATPTGISYEDVAKLRFPNARGLCSRASVVTATQAAPDDPVVITVADNHWLWPGDEVDFSGITGLATGHAVTVIDSTSFSVAFTGTFATYTSGGYVFNTGTTASDWAWDTTCSRHVYVIRGKSLVARNTYDESFTQGQLSPVGSHPSVLCISPNSVDEFPHGITYPFGTITADQCHGTEWREDFIQTINDPFWQAPPPRCVDPPATWSQDAYPCEPHAPADEELFYDYPPQVEPQMVKPTGAPTVPVTIWAEIYMDDACGSPCGSDVPINRETVHAWREAWEACTDWQVEANANC